MTDTADLLFELGTEELPPKALLNLSNALKSNFAQGLQNQKLEFSSIHAYATPRRLALLINDCVTVQPNQTIQRRGPAVKAAFDADGNPTKAALGFARSCNVPFEKLQQIKTEKGDWLGYQEEKAGLPANNLLPAIAEEALNNLPIPKRMRWGNNNYSFIRPIHWIVFLHGDQLIDCEIMGVKSSNQSRGHRFHHPDAINIDLPSDYEQTLLNSGFSVVDFSKRKESILNQVQQSAKALGGFADLDDDLVNEVTALTEWPVAITGSFEESFLEVPQEALVLTMKKNQKYFPLFDSNNRLLNHFITIANLDSPQPELIKDGNERVIRPRLSDAMFFWQQDGRKKLIDHVASLENVVFQKQLGSMLDKTKRVQKLALLIAEKLSGDIELTKRAALLSRCDLMTEMVNEFPEMQGHMGKYQAIRDQEKEQVADALFEFYLPRFAGDHLPKSKIGQAISLAERFDTVCGIFAIGSKPTGDKDPYGLRRATIGILRILNELKIDLNINELIRFSIDLQPLNKSATVLFDDIRDYIFERLKGIYLDKGIPVNIIQSVMATGPCSLIEFDEKIQAVITFKEQPQAQLLIDANKRIHNILKKQNLSEKLTINPALCSELEEIKLLGILRDNKDNVIKLVKDRDYTGSLMILASLKEPVDEFFNAVLVMDNNPAVRDNRLAILSELRELFLLTADFSHL